MKILSTKRDVAEYIAKLVVDIENGKVNLRINSYPEKYYHEQVLAILKVLSCRMGIPKEVDEAVGRIKEK